MNNFRLKYSHERWFKVVTLAVALIPRHHRVVINEILAPGDRYVRVAFEEAAKEIDVAITIPLTMLSLESV
ncbi:hypothetical protein DOY81_010773 [Sarcophaga bullata]|nr:hypothetical protein DOY81_010773 [Sarcophaga bullata]